MAKDHAHRPSKKVAEPSAENHHDALLKVEDEWLAARMRGDFKLTQVLLDDAYQGTTSDGVAQTKMDFVRAIELSGASEMEAEQVERSIRVYGHVAVSTGRAITRSAAREYSFRYLRVYHKKGGDWRLVASQPSRLP